MSLTSHIRQILNTEPTNRDEALVKTVSEFSKENPNTNLEGYRTFTSFKMVPPMKLLTFALLGSMTKLTKLLLEKGAKYDSYVSLTPQIEKELLESNFDYFRNEEIAPYIFKLIQCFKSENQEFCTSTIKLLLSQFKQDINQQIDSAIQARLEGIPNTIICKKITILDLAIIMGHSDIIPFLIENGAKSHNEISLTIISEHKQETKIDNSYNNISTIDLIKLFSNELTEDALHSLKSVRIYETHQDKAEADIDPEGILDHQLDTLGITDGGLHDSI